MQICWFSTFIQHDKNTVLSTFIITIVIIIVAAVVVIVVIVVNISNLQSCRAAPPGRSS